MLFSPVFCINVLKQMKRSANLINIDGNFIVFDRIKCKHKYIHENIASTNKMFSLAIYIILLVLNTTNIISHSISFHFLYNGYHQNNRITIQKIYLINLSISEGLKNFFNTLITVGLMVLPLLSDKHQVKIFEVQHYLDIFVEVTIVFAIYMNMFYMATDLFKGNTEDGINKSIKLIAITWLIGTWVGLSICIAVASSYIDYLKTVLPNTTCLRSFFDLVILILMIFIYTVCFYKFIRKRSEPFQNRNIGFNGEGQRCISITFHKYSVNVSLLLLSSFLLLVVVPHMALFMKYVNNTAPATIDTIDISFCFSDLCHAWMCLFSVREMKKTESYQPTSCQSVGSSGISYDKNNKSKVGRHMACVYI